MKQTILALLVVAALGLGLFLPSATSQPAPAARRTVLAPLRVGQAVSLKERGHLWEINVLQDSGPAGHKVVGVGDDYLVVVDDAAAIETRIPLTAIRAVTFIKAKQK